MTREQYIWSGFGVPLSWLAELDNIPAPNALADALGDRYLYRHCRIFASVRDAAVSLGYRFSAEDTCPFWRDYQSFSLTALHRILSDGIIPYFDTGTTFTRLLDANPGSRLPPRIISGNLKRNHVFHESAHCVAHSTMRRMDGDLRALAPHEGDRFVLEAILAESFANTVEVLGSVFQHMPLSDQVFYRLNSYRRHKEADEDMLERAGAELGAEVRFALLFFSHFEANLALDEAAEPAYERIAEAGGSVAHQAGIVREIVQAGFTLSAGFRESTTPAYFELLGCTREYTTLANARWLCRPQNRGFAQALTRILWEAAGKS